MLDVTLELLPEPGAAGSARRWASGLLSGAVPADVTDSVELVVTELVQNAVLHANTAMTLRLRSGADGVCVDVVDGSSVLPSSGLTSTEAMSGRGLLMVAAVAQTWGVDPRPDGKVVWACMSGEPSSSADEDEELDVDALLSMWSDEELTPLQRSDDAPVVVRGLPTATMLAVKTHNDDVLRELTLLALAEDPGTGPEAEVADLARRAREVLATFADGRQQVRNQVLAAVRAGNGTFDLVLSVDDDAARVLGDYLDILERSDSWSERGLLLSEAPEHEVRAVRRRYLVALLDQLPAR